MKKCPKMEMKKARYRTVHIVYYFFSINQGRQVYIHLPFTLYTHPLKSRKNGYLFGAVWADGWMEVEARWEKAFSLSPLLFCILDPMNMLLFKTQMLGRLSGTVS